MPEAKSQPCWTAETDFGVGKIRIVAPDAEERLSRILKLPSPAACRMTRDDRLACIRLGPHEWTIAGDAATVHAALANIEEAFGDDLALVLDMSHGAILLRLSGAEGTGHIAAYCDLDLHPTSFPTGHATRTRFGDVAVTLARLDDRPSFLLIGDQSYAAYLTLLLGHGAATSRPAHGRQQ